MLAVSVEADVIDELAGDVDDGGRRQAAPSDNEIKHGYFSFQVVAMRAQALTKNAIYFVPVLGSTRR